MERYIELEGGRSNSWALTGLIQTRQRDLLPLHLLGKLIIDSHFVNRHYPQKEITGVFMKNRILNYVTCKENNI
ncbi:hypothetical protein Bca52824_014638 [Brassica carinata]|uniref:Uncharacterized protein n=1 Tax=Brassica carinata TaxID=52824 RepID=A0A8X7W2R3_BRACI|nr:hypothetical protein Bca52824_014638 [Brassica carinata]